MKRTAANCPKSPFTFLVSVVAAIFLSISVAHIHAQTQAAMNAQARADFKQADAELNKTYQAVLAKLRDAESRQKLRETQRSWIASRDAEAARAAGEADGGSMAPTLRYETMTELTQERIKELKAMIDNATARPSKGPSNIPTLSPTPIPESQPEKPQSASKMEQAPSSSLNLVSPDGKWEYVDGEAPKLVKAGTNQVALDFLEQCDLGAVAEHSTLFWAPNSKRLAFLAVVQAKSITLCSTNCVMIAGWH